jgi:hypothetical protein
MDADVMDNAATDDDQTGATRGRSDCGLAPVYQIADVNRKGDYSTVTLFARFRG